MSAGSDAIKKLLDEAKRQQSIIAETVRVAERTLCKRRAKLDAISAEVRSLEADLAALQKRSHLTVVAQ